MTQGDAVRAIERAGRRTVGVVVAVVLVGLGAVGCEPSASDAPVTEASALDAEVTAVPEDGLARVEVVLADADAEADYEVVAIVDERRVTLSEEPTDAAAERRFSGLLEVPAGDFVAIDVVIDGPERALLTTGVVLDEPGGSIERIVDDDLLDTDGDGEPDTWRIGIAVEVVEPDTYRLNVDLADRDGVRVLSAMGTGVLDPGPGLIDVEVPFEVVERLASPGPLEVFDATLSRGEGAPIRTATRARVGSVAVPQW